MNPVNQIGEAIYFDFTPPKKKPERFPWPRKANDDNSIDIGVDVFSKKPDIEKLVHKFFKIDGYLMEDLLQEVYTAILHKNTTKSAHDPRKSSFGHYVFMIANNVCINIVSKKKRYDKEKESIYEPHESDGRTLEESYEAVETNFVDSDNVIELEEILRSQKKHDLARYVRASRTGASADVIRAALTYGKKRVSHKVMRDMRHQVVTFASQLSGSI